MDKRISKTYDTLLRAFFKLLRNHPYDELTVLDICKEAKSKDQLFIIILTIKEILLKKL